MRWLVLSTVWAACAPEPEVVDTSWGVSHPCDMAEAVALDFAYDGDGAQALCDEHEAVQLSSLTLTSNIGPDDLGCVCEVGTLRLWGGTHFDGLAHVQVQNVMIDRVPNLEHLRLGGSPVAITIEGVPDDAIIEFPNAVSPPIVNVTNASPAHLDGLTNLRTLGNVFLSRPTPGRVEGPLSVQRLTLFGANWGPEHDLGCVTPDDLEISTSDVPRFACEVHLQGLFLLRSLHAKNLQNVDADVIHMSEMADVADLGVLSGASPSVLLLTSMPALESLSGLATTSSLTSVTVSLAPKLGTLPALPALQSLNLNNVGVADLGPAWPQSTMQSVSIASAGGLSNLDALASLEQVEELRLWNLDLDDAHGLDGVRRVGVLSLGGRLPPVAPNLQQARQVELGLGEDSDLPFWPSLEQLEFLKVFGQSAMRDVVPLRYLRQVDVLQLIDNRSLTDLSGLHDLERVGRLSFANNLALTSEEIDALVLAIDDVGEVER